MKNFAMMVAAVLALLVLAVPAGAATKFLTSMIYVPAACPPFSCSVDSVKKAGLKILGSDASGANGLKGILTISGLSKAGVPVNLNGLTLSLQLSIDGGACSSYESVPFDIVDGSAKLKFTAADLTPPVAEAPGSAVLPCLDFAIVGVGGQTFLVNAVTLGADAD